jgi:hypothetical protein
MSLILFQKAADNIKIRQFIIAAVAPNTKSHEYLQDRSQDAHE